MSHDTKNFEINAVCSVQQSKNNLKLEITQRRSLEKPNSRKSNALGVIIIIRAWMFNSEFHVSLSDRVEI